METKQQFIIALIFVCFFLVLSAFVFIYGMITNTLIWNEFQPYFTALIGPVGVILGYYFKNYTSDVKIVATEKQLQETEKKLQTAEKMLK